MRLRRTAAAVAALALLAGACTDDDTDVEEGGGLAGLVESADPVDADLEVEAPPEETDDDPPSDDGAARGEAVETAAVEVDGAPLPLIGPVEDTSAGTPAPALHGTSIDGRPMSIVPGDGPMIVGFFAHWCPHCQAEVPVVVDWMAEGGLPDDVRFLAVSTAMDDTRENFPPSAWFAGEGWDVPTLADDMAGTAHEAYGWGGFPYWVVLDAEGAVVDRVEGELPASALDQLVAAARS